MADCKPTTPSTTESATNRIDLIERCTRAGYEARRTKTGSPPWELRDPDSQRRYREIVTAAFDELEAAGLRIVPDALLIACGYLITFGDKDTDLARTTHAQIEAYRSTAAPTPARSHAAGAPGEGES